MKTFRFRLICNVLVTLAAILAAWIATRLIDISLRHDSFFTGWLLFACFCVLALFNARKKLPYVNLLRANVWLQFHVYLGLFSVAVFAMHVHFRLPNGHLEQLLAFLYVLLAGSGLVGIWLSRRIPSRLSRRGEQVLYERIPTIRVRLQSEIEQLALGGLEVSDSTTLVDLYTDLLVPFLSGPRNFWFHVFESNRPYHQLREKIRLRHRYMNDREKEIMSKISHRIRIKDDLDYQYAGQALLKRWLLVHIPVTYALSLFTLLHLTVVYAFIGDI